MPIDCPDACAGHYMVFLNLHLRTNLKKIVFICALSYIAAKSSDAREEGAYVIL